jgi:hypothetical protein
MDQLPDHLLYNILIKMTDVRSVANLAMTNRACREAVARIRVIQRVVLPQRKITMHPDNAHFVSEKKQKGFHFCLFCWFCGSMIPVTLGARVIFHACDKVPRLFPDCPNPPYVKFPMWTNCGRAVLYRGPDTEHFVQPLPCSDEWLKTYKIPRPNVYPYVPLHA